MCGRSTLPQCKAALDVQSSPQSREDGERVPGLLGLRLPLVVKMALACWARGAKDCVSYLANWKFNYQKTRVIGSLRHLDEAMERFVSTPFFVKFNRRAILYYPVARGDHGTPYALFYEEALFLNYIVKHWKFDTSRLSKFELEDYNLAVKKLQDWHDLKSFCKEVKDLVGEIKRILYFRRITHSKVQSLMWGYPTFEEEINAKYAKLLTDLKAWPAWQERVKAEVEPMIKLLSDQVVYDQEAIQESPFANFDKNAYFK